jgi:hypothetical protein
MAPRRLSVLQVVTPEDTIRDLLLSFSDARSPLVKGDGGKGGDGLPSMSPTWNHGSYESLEQALKEMYSLGKQQSVCEIPLQTLYWHLRQRYLDSERKAVWKVGERTVDSMVRRKSCICGYSFRNPEQARKHIELVHKPKPGLTQIYSKQYQRLLHDHPGRCDICEKLAIRWLCNYFLRHGITPRLPKEK